MSAQRNGMQVAERRRRETTATEAAHRAMRQTAVLMAEGCLRRRDVRRLNDALSAIALPDSAVVG